MGKENGLLNKDECRRRYEEGLAQFAQPGHRDYMVTRGGFVNWGKAAGLSADEIISDARAAGVTDRDGSIRSAWESSTMHPDDATATARKQQPKRGRVAPTIRAKDKYAVRTMTESVSEPMKGCAAWLRDLSPDKDVFALPPHLQTTSFLRAILPPDNHAYMFANLRSAEGKEYATPGKIGLSVRRCAEWVKSFESRAVMGYDHIVPNPLTGRQGMSKSGKPSFISADCISSFPFLIIEFDDMALPWQYSFWRAFITTPHPLASRLVAIVYSGNKSLHGLLHVGCATRAEWDAARRIIAPLFGADENRGIHEDAYLAFCADGQAMQPRQGFRLPGVRRCDECGNHTGAMQELLYLNPSTPRATTANVPKPKSSPAVAPTMTPTIECHQVTAFPHECRTCPTIGDCRHAFGKYWGDRSHGGKGCKRPFAYERKAGREPTHPVAW